MKFCQRSYYNVITRSQASAGEMQAGLFYHLLNEFQWFGHLSIRVTTKSFKTNSENATRDAYRMKFEKTCSGRDLEAPRYRI